MEPQYFYLITDGTWYGAALNLRGRNIRAATQQTAQTQGKPMKRAVRTAIATALVSFCLCSAAGAEIVTIDIPGAVGVIPSAMNDKGRVTGYYYNKAKGYHGFIWQLHGALARFDVPNAELTVPVGISAKGVVTGGYNESPEHVSEGFVRAADGTITPFRAPDGHGTYVASANRNGWCVGATGGKDRFHLFLRSPTGETTEFTVPGSSGEQVDAVNRSRMIAGSVYNAGNGSAFARSAPGKITMFGDGSTSVTAMNDLGAIVGRTYANGTYTGYVRTSDRTITTFAVNGALETRPLAINNSGTIAGEFEASDQTWHGFIRTPDGTLTPFDVAGSVFTAIVAINNNGVIAGRYKNAAGDNLGFFGTP